jgi:hypothetical protein
MTKESASAYDFLSSFDIDLNTVTKLGGILRRQPVPFRAPQPSTYADVSITGHSRARTHRPSEKVTGNVGWEITSVRTPAVFAFYQCHIVTEVSPPSDKRQTLSKYLATLPRDRLTMKLGARLTSLVVEDGRVVGVKYTKIARDGMGTLTTSRFLSIMGTKRLLSLPIRCCLHREGTRSRGGTCRVARRFGHPRHWRLFAC